MSASGDEIDELISIPKLVLPLSALKEPEADDDIDQRISHLCSLPNETILKRNGQFSLTEIQMMAQHLLIPKFQSKEALVNAIREKSKNRATLSSIEENSQYIHRKVIHTFPRMLGFIMADPDSLSRSRTLASRTELQLQQTNDANPLYIQATKKFNSPERGADIPLSTLSDSDNDVL